MSITVRRSRRGSGGRRRRAPATAWVCGGFALLILLGAPRTVPAARAQTDLRVAAVKAAFVYNFAKFAEWPPDAFASSTDPVRLCFYDNSVNRAALAPLREKRIAQRPVRIRSFMVIPPKGVCHVVFIGRDASAADIRNIIRYGETSHVLTVSDAPRFAEKGGHIGLFSTNNRLRFRINLGATRSSRIALSSKLLQLAVIVKGADNR